MSTILKVGNLVCRRSADSKIFVLKIVSRSSSSSSFEQNVQKFMIRHAKRQSPMSPYMLGTTYKIQLTSLLSITHRITGLGLGFVVYCFGWAALSKPNKNFAQLLQSFKEFFPSWYIDAVKFLAGTGFAFHTFNGVRHLAWDMGYGFALKDLYKSGYLVIGLTVLVAMAILVQQQQQ